MDTLLHEKNVLREKIKRWISPTMNVNIEYVDEIERSSTGKFKAVVSKLN